MDMQIIGIFETEEAAIRAIKRLRVDGYTDDEISVLAKKKDKLDRIEEATHKHAENVDTEDIEGAKGAGETDVEGAAVGTGAVAGGVLGGAGVLLAELGVFAIPGVGPLLAAGPIALTLGGIIAGGAAGGVVGALVDLGFDKKQAKEYEDYLNEGNIIILVDGKEYRGLVHENFHENESLNREQYNMGVDKNIGSDSGKDISQRP